MSSLFPQSSINSQKRILKHLLHIVDDVNNNFIYEIGKFHARFWPILTGFVYTVAVARVWLTFKNNPRMHHYRDAFKIDWLYVILYTILCVSFWWFFAPVVLDFCVLLRDLLELSKNDNPSNYQLGWRIFVTFLQNQLDSQRVVLIFIVVVQGFLFRWWSKTVVTVVDNDIRPLDTDEIKKKKVDALIKRIDDQYNHLRMEPEPQKREEIRREIRQLELKLDQITGHIDSPDDYLLNKSLDFDSLDDDVDWFNQALSNPDYEDGEDEFPLPKI
jgi:hypothetical protein